VRWLHRVEKALEKGGPRRGRRGARARASRAKLDVAAGI
jgi:hypothetical protein